MTKLTKYQYPDPKDLDTIDRLNKLAESINAEIVNAESLAQQATDKAMQAGVHLLEARALLPGDCEFGTWARAFLPGLSQQYRNKLMALAREFFDDSRARSLPRTVLIEMIPASDILREEFLEDASKGVKPTRSQVKAMVDEDKTVVSVTDESEEPALTEEQENVERRKYINEWAPHFLPLVDEGKMTLGAAYKQAIIAKAKQKQEQMAEAKAAKQKERSNRSPLQVAAIEEQVLAAVIDELVAAIPKRMVDTTDHAWTWIHEATGINMEAVLKKAITLTIQLSRNNMHPNGGK